MLTISFTRSKSKYYRMAVEQALELGATYDGETVRLEVPVYELLYAYEQLFPLIRLISKWNTAKATYKGKKVPLYRFIFLVWNKVRVCAQEHNDTLNDRHCWTGYDFPGWGCRHLCKMHKHQKGSGDYKTSSRYWYNHGEFNENGEWIINKNHILELLMKEAEEKALDTCPFFDKEIIQKAVQDLPEKIIPDGFLFRIHYIDEFEDGEQIRKPVNLRHVHQQVVRMGVGSEHRIRASTYDIVDRNPELFSLN